MPKDVTKYSILISCPSDVKDEITAIGESVVLFNTQFSDTLGIILETKHSKKDSFSQSGNTPQSILNEQFVADCDAAIAVFWTRFGTPTDEYGSGTEEEIEIMLDSGKQVFMYFSDNPIPPSRMDSEEYEKICKFRERYKDRGLYFTYSTIDGFRKLLFSHLSMYFLSEKRAADAKLFQPNLALVGIDPNNQITDKAHIISFVPHGMIDTNQILDSICELVNHIGSIKTKSHASQTEVMSPLLRTLYNPVEIEQADKNLVLSFTEKLEISIDDDFFNLGGLSYETFAPSMQRRRNIIGTDEEQMKYNLIKQLVDMIKECMRCFPIQEAFSDMRCVKLALQNRGTSIDEDIEITLTIPHDAFLDLNEFPKLDNNEMQYMLRNLDIDSFFAICSTSEYLEYSDSITKVHSSPIRHTIDIPFLTPDYSEEYEDVLKSTFCYDIYDEGDCYKVKLTIDYINHNTTVAFPTVLLVKAPFERIEYRITSKHTSEVVLCSINVIFDDEN